MTRQPEAVDLVAGADFLYPMGNTGEIVTYGEVAVRGDTIIYAGARKEAGS